MGERHFTLGGLIPCFCTSRWNYSNRCIPTLIQPFRLACYLIDRGPVTSLVHGLPSTHMGKVFFCFLLHPTFIPPSPPSHGNPIPHSKRLQELCACFAYKAPIARTISFSFSVSYFNFYIPSILVCYRCATRASKFDDYG